MPKSKWKRLVVIVWLAGMTALCLWTPHKARLSGEYQLLNERMGIRYALTWNSPRSGIYGLLYSHIDYGRLGLTLIAWSGFMFVIFILCPEDLPERYKAWQERRQAGKPRGDLQQGTLRVPPDRRPSPKEMNRMLGMEVRAEPGQGPVEGRGNSDDSPYTCPVCHLVNLPGSRFCDCGYDFVTWTARKANAKPEPESPLYGVHGWLAVFCVATTASGAPLLLYAYEAATAVLAALYVALAALSIYTGIDLWLKRLNALRWLKAYLIVALALGFLMLIGAAVRPGTPANPGYDFIGSAIHDFIFVAIWWAYFHRSKRVKATFGQNL